MGAGAVVDSSMVYGVVLLLRTHGIAVPPDLVAAARALATLQGTVQALSPEVDLLAEFRAVAAERPDVLLTGPGCVTGWRSRCCRPCPGCAGSRGAWTGSAAPWSPPRSPSASR